MSSENSLKIFGDIIAIISFLSSYAPICKNMPEIVIFISIYYIFLCYLYLFCQVNY